MEKVITRTFFCQKCADKSSPKKEDIMVLYRTEHEDTIITPVKKNSRNKGFTPHILHYEKQGKKYRVLYSCAIVGCGVTIHKVNEEQYDISFIKTNETFFSENEMQVLIKFTNNGYEV